MSREERGATKVMEGRIVQRVKMDKVDVIALVVMVLAVVSIVPIMYAGFLRIHMRTTFLTPLCCTRLCWKAAILLLPSLTR